LQVANEKQEPAVDKSATGAETWDLGFSTSTFLVENFTGSHIYYKNF